MAFFVPPPSTRMIIYVQTSAIIAVGSYIGITLASMVYSSGRFGGAQADLLLREDKKGPREECSQAKHFGSLTEFVATLYSGQEMASHCKGPSQRHPHVHLDPNVTFEDPAAICAGRNEVWEAFRALQLTLHPESLRPPRCIDVKPQGASLDVTYALYQRYYFLGSTITLPSLLRIEVQLQQRSEIPQSDLVILRMQEEWNGVPLLTTFLNRWVRRGNGWASYHLTRWVVRST